MRDRAEHGGLAVCAFAATNAVLLTWNVCDRSILKDTLGFAIHKEEVATGRKYFLISSKTFPPSAPAPQPEQETGDTSKKSLPSTLSSPIQGFSWSDYSARSGTECKRLIFFPYPSYPIEIRYIYYISNEWYY